MDHVTGQRSGLEVTAVNDDARYRPATSHEDALARLIAFLEVHDDPALYAASPDSMPMWLSGGVTIFMGDLRRVAQYQRKDPLARGEEE